MTKASIGHLDIMPELQIPSLNWNTRYSMLIRGAIVLDLQAVTIRISWVFLGFVGWTMG